MGFPCLGVLKPWLDKDSVVLESCSEHLGGPKKHHKSLHTAAVCVGDRIENTKWRIGNFLFLMENGSEIALMFGINILNARSS